MYVFLSKKKKNTCDVLHECNWYFISKIEKNTEKKNLFNLKIFYSLLHYNNSIIVVKDFEIREIYANDPFVGLGGYLNALSKYYHGFFFF